MRSVADCASCGHERAVHAHGWCHTCYGRWHAAGKPAGGPPSPRAAYGRDIDEIAVERAIAGDPGVLNPVERRIAITTLTAAGLSAPRIAARIRCTKRTVERHRRAMRNEAAA